jgi:hypothetical protein
VTDFFGTPEAENWFCACTGFLAGFCVSSSKAALDDPRDLEVGICGIGVHLAAQPARLAAATPLEPYGGAVEQIALDMDDIEPVDPPAGVGAGEAAHSRAYHAGEPPRNAVPRRPEPDEPQLLAMARSKLRAIGRGQDKGWEPTAAAREVLPGGMESDVARLVRKFGEDEPRLMGLAAAAPSKIAEKSKQSSETNRNWAKAGRPWVKERRAAKTSDKC